MPSQNCDKLLFAAVTLPQRNSGPTDLPDPIAFLSPVTVASPSRLADHYILRRSLLDARQDDVLAGPLLRTRVPFQVQYNSAPSSFCILQVDHGLLWKR